MVTYLKALQLAPGDVDDAVATAAAAILNSVREHGESSVREFSKEFDDWSPASFRLSPDQIAEATEQVPLELRRHITDSERRIRFFAERQMECLSPLRVTVEPGVVAGHHHLPVQSVGAYIPGGRYQLISSALMSVVPATVAGVERVVACVAPRRGVGPSPASVHAAALAGATEIWSFGGAHALAALAYGAVDGLDAVDMLVGAGNDYVAQAKRLLASSGKVGIDMYAGPTEVLVIADSSVPAHTAAVDVLSQAEHGPTSATWLLTIDRAYAEEFIREIPGVLADWETRSVAQEAWDKYGAVIVADDLDELISLSDELACEHVQIMTEHDDILASRLRNYGSLFVGPHAPVAFGDKTTGPNHTLPTQRTARHIGGLSALTYLRTVTFQELTSEGAAAVGPAAVAISAAEGLVGHAVSAALRMPSSNDVVKPVR